MEAQTQMQQLVPVFNGGEYELWSIKMKTLLMSRDLWDVIEDETSDQPMEEELAKSQRDLRIKDMSALYMLQMSVTDTIFLRIARATSSKQAWELLKAEFGETERIRSMKKQNVGMMYENLIMGEEESVDEFAWRVMNLANRLRFYGRNIPDDDVIFRILMKLPASYHESVSYIRTLKDVTITEVVEMLRGDEWRQTLMDEEASGSQKWCEFCRKKSHDTSECYSKNKKVRR
ncbi:uncharacterized protein LOC130509107 [Raphanus sativus]|uniref:Uncharacterized protein LOC130509107 n=1 Tax=Raphanus sativus TaxID=3726 RepID=A0A9W3DA13_RAPSA|nr:uncharacterized protein LOC130509107 [Raphanus sativus]XP_056860716.1 uncharacterized protein LOC130509107 [Raphanus sativus]